MQTPRPTNSHLGLGSWGWVQNYIGHGLKRWNKMKGEDEHNTKIKICDDKNETGNNATYSAPRTKIVADEETDNW